ncbi:MAG: hypothetical protein HY042_11395 [Spirochaetia bacterium]|nr:hypothetical protein [Spirochaetia bacterium]
MNVRLFTFGALLAVISLIALASGASCQTGGGNSGTAKNPGEISLQAINVVRKAPGIYVYTYKETLNPIDPRKDYESVRRLTDEKIIAQFRRLMSENAGYKQQFTARCMPVWDYGIEFRDKDETRTFLFSFRCDTLKLVEDKIFRDFSPQHAELYNLFSTQINDRTSVPGNK